ncbi:MAG: YfiR family protein [Rhodospirillaceae bacterium]|jgi:hypothetical protein|nr:YfiR family protein [Rhodospirillaceae bacterium]MBT5663963.1 YfiR family protein [Rhodospirillaceae bacterium]
MTFPDNAYPMKILYRIKLFFGLFLIVSSFMLVPTLPTFGQSTSTENDIKAAFVFNFIKFVEWPENNFSNLETAIKLCVWDGNNLDGAIDKLRSKTAKKRSIQVVSSASLDGMKECNVLFIANVDRRALREIIENTSGKNILTVSDIHFFAELGGIIGLFQSGEQMRFAINLDAARQSGLRISSNLLKLGKIVSTEE